jgi:hypothetical protein
MAPPYSTLFRAFGWSSLAGAAAGAWWIFGGQGLVASLLTLLSGVLLAGIWFAGAWALDALQEIKARLVAGDQVAARDELAALRPVADYNGVTLAPGSAGGWTATMQGETRVFATASDAAGWLKTLPKPKN